jgi:hypothetical protein
MLWFAFAFPLSVFTPLIGRPVEFNFLFFDDASGAFSFLCEAPEGRMLSACESLKGFCEELRNGRHWKELGERKLCSFGISLSEY